MHRVLRIFILASFSFGLASCVTSVNRVGTDTDIDVSGTWNDVDSRKVSMSLAEEIVDQSWYNRYLARLPKETVPVLIVGRVRNNSNEHINTETFTKDIEIALINSGKVDIVASTNQQADLRDERQGQSNFVSEESRKQLRNELGADIILLGSINTIDDIEGRRSVRYYQVDMELIDIESNRKLWIGQQEIKKFVQKPLIRL